MSTANLRFQNPVLLSYLKLSCLLIYLFFVLLPIPLAVPSWFIRRSCLRDGCHLLHPQQIFSLSLSFLSISICPVSYSVWFLATLHLPCSLYREWVKNLSIIFSSFHGHQRRFICRRRCLRNYKFASTPISTVSMRTSLFVYYYCHLRSSSHLLCRSVKEVCFLKKSLGVTSSFQNK